MTNNLSKTSIQRIFLSLLFISVSGFLVGAFVSVVSTVIYLVFLFPLGMGIAAIVITERAIKSNKIRIPLLGVAFYILAGIIIYGTFQYGNYLTFRAQASEILVKKLTAEYGKPDNNVANQIVDSFLEKETGYSNFLGYVLLQAKNGISIGHLFSSSYSNIGPFFTWIYWLIEIVIIFGMGIGSAKNTASQPFCEMHDRWYESEQHIGGVEISKSKNLFDFIKQKDFFTLGRILEKNTDMPSIEIYIQNCKNCNVNTWLLVKQVYVSKTGKVVFNNILQTTITPLQKNELIREAKS